MKNIFLSILASVIVMSCGLGDDNQKASIIGKWKLIETYDDPGDGTGYWIKVSDDDSYTYQFNDDNTFIRSGSNNDCLNGKYYTEQTDLFLSCNDNDYSAPTYSHTCDNIYLILNGAPYSCDESCAEKFKRID